MSISMMRLARLPRAGKGERGMKWVKVLDDERALPENRVTTARAGDRDVGLVNFEGKICALDNQCPHQGGPLGEGSIEQGLLRCPWHGWDFDPCTGKAPGYDDGVDTYRVKIECGAVYVGLPEEAARGRTVSDLVVETLLNWGIDTVFGIVGHSNLGLADAFRKAEEKGLLRYMGVRHEGAGAFAAPAYRKLTGRPAVCFAIAGPGSTNMYTGLWDAKVDRAPIVALTGQVATQVVGTGNFQETDLVRAFAPVARFNHRVQRDSRYAELVNLAVKHAIIERDVSHLTFSDEVQTLPVGEKAKAGSTEGRMPAMTVQPARPELEAAVGLIRRAEKPMIIIGHGARKAMESIIALADRLGCPVATTFKGKGLLTDDHPLACGVLGRSGTPVASYFMN